VSNKNRAPRKFILYCPEKFPAVAQAFQPVLITGAGETPTLQHFMFYIVGREPRDNCL